MKVGILGGGQLARMIALAGYPLGVHFIVLDPDPNAGAGGLSEHLLGAYDDPPCWPTGRESGRRHL